ncbi:transmembrane domain protein [Frog virus 3]|uniref:Transmembrane domain protein n=1 Tax=Frog virus 3 TaxID=10493 RepID=A0A5B8P182_FRG3V|nr:transmembrane domain protein [Frog virus 3]
MERSATLEMLNVHKPDARQTGDILSRYANALWPPALAYAASVAGPHGCRCGKAMTEAARVGVFLGVLCALYNWMGSGDSFA